VGGGIEIRRIEEVKGRRGGVYRGAAGVTLDRKEKKKTRQH